MSMSQHRQAWPIARLLFSTHIPALLFLWVMFAVVVVGLIIALAILTPTTGSIWAGATTFVRWFSLGFGVYLIRQLLPMHVAHGQTRRDFMLQASLFTLVATIALCVLMMLGFVLESVVYRVMDRQQALTVVQAFIAPGRLATTFFTAMALYLVWIVSGTLLGAAFYRNDGWFLVAVPVALILLTIAGAAPGFVGLPFITRIIDNIGIPLIIVAPLSAGMFLLSLVMTWAMLRDITVRTRTG